MARTRNSDPGRDRALHYAATPGRRHAKPLVYACWLVVAAVAPLRAGDQAAGAPEVPCVPCQILSVAPEQVPALPARLAGIRLLIRVAPDAVDGAWRAAFEDLLSRGASA